MKKFIFCFVVLFWTISLVLFAQKENYNWYFPNRCAVTFNNPNVEPVPLFDSKLINSATFPSTISDNEGNLLFYCGCSFVNVQSNTPFYKFGIFDKTHTELLGAEDDFDTYRSILINYPGKKNLYLCITSPYTPRKGEFAFWRFDIIDKTKRNGLGGITNTFFSNSESYLLGAYKHSNNIDWWLVGLMRNTPGLGQMNLKCYLFTNKGISDSAVSYLSLPSNLRFPDEALEANLFLTSSEFELVPILTVSEEVWENPPPFAGRSLGHKECSITFLKFNYSTGRVSISGSFKVCDTCWVRPPIFSSDKKKIYIVVTKIRPTSTNYLYLKTAQLYQFTYSDDMKAIERSKAKVGPTKVDYWVDSSVYDPPPPPDPDGKQPLWFTMMKLGPNGKIYILHSAPANYISEISNTDADAKDVVYKDTAVFFGDRIPDGFPWTMHNGYNIWLELSSNSPLCKGDSLRLNVVLSDPKKKPTKVVWEGPMGFKSSKQNPTLVAQQSGYYKVTVFVSGTEITDSIWVDVGNSVPPKIIAPKQFCRGDTIEIKVDKGYSAYFWSTGDTTKNIKVWETGRYYVRVIDSIGCSGYDTVFIEVIDVPAKIFGGKAICKGKSVVLEAFPKGSQYRYVWSTGDTSEQIVANRGGIYWVVVTNEMGCKGTDTVEVKELPYLEFTIEGDTLLCTGSAVELVAPLRGSGYSYLWSTGETTDKISITRGGTYWLRIIDENGCEGYDTIEVEESAKPEAKITGEGDRRTLCKGEKMKLTAEPIGNYRYFWSNGATETDIEITQGGSYWLVVENEYGCRDTAWIEIEEHEAPKPTITGDTIICPGKMGQLEAEGNYVSYLWSTGATTKSIQVEKAGAYWVEVTDTNGCRARAERYVDEYEITISGIEPIGFGMVVVDSSVKREVRLENRSNTRIRIKEIRLKEGVGEYNIKASTPMEIAEGEGVSFEVIYTSKGKQWVRDTIIIVVDLPCEEEYEIPVVGKSKGIKTFVWLPDTAGIIGTKGYCIPLQAKSEEVELEDLSYEATIRFDATALYPDDKDSPIEDGERVVTLTGSGIKLGSDPITIGSFCGEVLLARSERVALRIDKFEWMTGNVEVTTRDGSLTVTGVCQPGVSQIEMYQPTEITIIPNPAEDEVEITIRGERGTEYTLEVTNILGMTMEHILVKMEESKTKLKKQLKDYPLGVYFIRVGGKIAKFMKL